MRSVMGVPRAIAPGGGLGVLAAGAAACGSRRMGLSRGIGELVAVVGGSRRRGFTAMLIALGGGAVWAARGWGKCLFMVRSYPDRLSAPSAMRPYGAGQGLWRGHILRLKCPPRYA